MARVTNPATAARIAVSAHSGLPGTEQAAAEAASFWAALGIDAETTCGQCEIRDAEPHSGICYVCRAEFARDDAAERALWNTR